MIRKNYQISPILRDWYIDGFLVFVLMQIPVLLFAIYSLNLVGISLTYGFFIIMVFIILFGIILLTQHSIARKSGMFDAKNEILFNDNDITIKLFKGGEQIIKGEEISQIELESGMRFGIRLYAKKSSIHYIKKQVSVSDMYSQNINNIISLGNHVWICIGMPTKEQYTELEKEIVEFKRRNNIMGCVK